jgi:hypothetical protein
MHDASGDAPAIDHRRITSLPESLHESHMTELRRFSRTLSGLRSSTVRLLFPLLLLSIALISAACTSQGAAGAGSTEAREAALREVAAGYAQTGDLAQAQDALDKLNLANPGQLLVALAEADLAAGRPREEIEAAARLAEALGARSQKLIAYFAPTQAVASPAPTVLAATVMAPTAVPPTAAPPTKAPTATAAPPTATDVPPTEAPSPTSSPTPEPQEPRVVADGAVNLRSGPGRAYPVVGQLPGGREAAIVGRNASGDWWQVEQANGTLAWVAGTVVRVLGAIDTVAVAKNIPPVPTAPPRPTAAPQPTAPPVAAGPAFRVVEKRLWNVTETGGFYDGPSVHCGEKRELHVRVLDAAGNPLNGVTVRGNLSHVDVVTGHKGVPGNAEFVLGGGDEVSIIRDVDGREVSSDYVAGLTTTSSDISRDVLSGAGFCVEDGTCDAFLKNWGCLGHHSWTVTFRRAY